MFWKYLNLFQILKSGINQSSEEEEEIILIIDLNDE